MTENNDAITISIYFGQKDGALYDWVTQLPWGAFSLIIRQVIKAYIEGVEYKIPDFYENVKKKERRLSTTKTAVINREDDQSVYEYVLSLDDYNRSHNLKEILKGSLLGERGSLIDSNIGLKQKKPLEVSTPRVSPKITSAMNGMLSRSYDKQIISINKKKEQLSADTN